MTSGIPTGTNNGHHSASFRFIQPSSGKAQYKTEMLFRLICWIFHFLLHLLKGFQSMKVVQIQDMLVYFIVPLVLVIQVMFLPPSISPWYNSRFYIHPVSRLWSEWGLQLQHLPPELRGGRGGHRRGPEDSGESGDQSDRGQDDKDKVS